MGSAGFNTSRNHELWFQQNLLSDKISIRLGQLAADKGFVISDYAASFLNGTFGWPAFMYMNLPSAALGSLSTRVTAANQSACAVRTARSGFGSTPTSMARLKSAWLPG